MIHKLGSKVLWDGPHYLNLWSGRLDRERAKVETWLCELPRDPQEPERVETSEKRARTRVVLPLAVRRANRVFLYSSELKVKPGDELHVLIQQDRREVACAWLRQQGWREAPTLTEADVD